MLNKSILIVLLTFIASSLASSQHFEHQRVSVLTINENDSLAFVGDTLVVDSLIMHDNSLLYFVSDAYVKISNSFIGQNTKISAEGIDGINGQNGTSLWNHGTDGTNATDGHDLQLIINFNKVGSLVISTSGGKGGNGGSGFSPPRIKVNGQTGFDGGNGGSAGQGGDSGNLSVFYTYSKEHPVFNRNGDKNSIYLLTNAGSCGKPGKAGKGGKGGKSETIRTGDSDILRAEGANGIDGTRGASCNKTVKDGKLTLKNLTE